MKKLRITRLYKYALDVRAPISIMHEKRSFGGRIERDYTVIVAAIKKDGFHYHTRLYSWVKNDEG